MKCSRIHQEIVAIKPIGFVLLIIISILFSLICFESTSPLYATDGDDSVVFKSMGLAILEGRTPYVDYFDHKGPILYFINAFGQLLIPGNWGLFILEIMASFVVFTFLIKIAKTTSGNLKSTWLAFIVGVFIYWVTGKGGNTCEEWELLAIVPSLYYTLKYIYSGKRITLLKLGLLLGLCFAFCFYIRPNDAVSQVGGLVVSVFIFLLINKAYRKILILIGGCFLGFVIPSFFIALFFFYKVGTIDDLIYGLIGHNLLYSGNFFTGLMSSQKIIAFAFIAVCATFIYSNDRNSFSLLLVVMPSLLLGWILLGNRMYSHYFIVFIPSIVVISAFLFQNTKIWKRLLFVLALSLFIFYDISSLSSLVWRVRYNLGASGIKSSHELLEKNFQQEGELLINLVPKDEQDSIWNFNLSFNRFAYTGIFWKNGIMQMNRIPFYEMAFIDPMLAESDNIEKKKPLWITLTHENDDLCEAAGKDVGRLFNYFQPGYDYIEANYDRVARTDTTICDIELWRRRDATDNNLLKETL